MSRVIKARALTESASDKSHLGRLISHAGAPNPERLESAYSLMKNVVLIYRRHHGKYPYWVEVAVSKDTEITIHDEP